MMYVSNPRHASELLIRLVAFLLLIQALGPGASIAAVKNMPMELILPAEMQPTAEQESWLREDRSWLAGLTPGQRRPSPHAGLAAAADTQAMVSQWIMAQVGQDTLKLARTLTSRLRDRWLDRGYLSARVRRAGKEPAPQIIVDPGPRFRLGELEISGPQFQGRDHLLRIWLPETGESFSAPTLARGIQRILIGAGEVGYPFARWVTSEVTLNPENSLVNIRAALLPGQRSYIGPITSDLPSGRPSEFLARASGLRPGSLFQQTEVQRSAERLLARDLYASVALPQVYPTASVDTVGLHFSVVSRRKVNRLQIVLGLSRRQDQGPSRVSGEVDFRLPNLAGSGRNLGFNWRDDGNLRSHFGFDYLEPMAFGTPLDMGLALDSEVETDSFTRFRLNNRWQFPVVALWGLELGAGWDRSTYPVGILEQSSRVRARGAFLHRRGDRSRSGWSGAFAIETAWRSSSLRPTQEGESSLGNQLGEALTQRIYEIDTEGEAWLGHAWSLAGRVSFRHLSGSEESIPLAEQFRFGGAASLRGYREDEFHGSKAAWGGVELRIGPPGGSRLYTFYDLGYFGFSALESDLEGNESRVWKRDWPRGYGLGLLARTPGGDISLAIGFPGSVDFDLAKLHVTLLESF